MSFIRALPSLLAGTMATLWAADPSQPAHFEVTPTVMVEGSELFPIGFMNFCEPMGALKSHHNSVFREASCEIPPERWFGLAESVEDQGARVRLDGHLQSRVAGSCVGVNARIYRIVDRMGRALPLAADGKYLDVSKADHVIQVGKRKVSGYHIESPAKPFRSVYEFAEGPEIHQWDAIFLEVERDHLDDLSGESSWGFTEKNDPSQLSAVAHPIAPPAEVDLGTACLAFRPAAGEHGIKQTVFGSADQSWYGQLYPGQTYRLDVWMRQEGLGEQGKVRFAIAGPMYGGVASEFIVGNEWERFSYTFVAPPLPTGRMVPGGPAFYATGPGTLYIDQPRIVAYDEEADLDRPFVVDRRLVAAMLSSQPETGRKGFVRSWAAMVARSMDQVLSWYPPLGSDFRRAETIPMALSYCEATGSSPEDRMCPWLTINLWYSEEEWSALIEYLAAPYDLQRDSPQAKPWAWRRVQQRGHPRPWIDDFACINIELGNENWHNRAAHEWLGFGRSGWVHAEGFQYGLWGRYLYQQVLEKSPYWSQELSQKIIWNLGGGYYGALDKNGEASGYGPDSMRGAWPTSTMSSMALYVGPRLELGEKFEDTLSDEMVQRALLAYQSGVLDKVLATDAARQKLAGAGIRYGLFSYEGGPAGYDQDRTPLKITMGKSLALGLATAEAWLDSYQHGWRGHMLYASNQGDNWSNLSSFADGMHGTPAWQAMGMINRTLQIGDMLRCDERSVPTIDLEMRDKKGKPVLDRKTKKPLMQTLSLARCFAFRKGDQVAIGILNLKLPGQHDGVDLGNGEIPCTVKLPFTAARKIHAIRMTGGALDGNDAVLRVKPEPFDLDPGACAGGMLTLGALPAASFTIISFTGVTP